jgi:5-methylcytosine-specific restriction endonuclease McrA
LKNHTSIYANYFGYSEEDFVPCECCEGRAVDIHHIVARGMGGVKNNRLDIIENLQAVCRKCHDTYGDKPSELEYLVKKHAIKLKIGFDELWNIIKDL